MSIFFKRGNENQSSIHAENVFTTVHAEMEGEPKRAKIVKLKQIFVRKKGEKLNEETDRD